MDKKTITRQTLLTNSGFLSHVMWAVILIAIPAFLLIGLLRLGMSFDTIAIFLLGIILIGVYCLVLAIKERNIILNGEILIERLTFQGFYRPRVNSSTYYYVFEDGRKIRYRMRDFKLVSMPGDQFYLLSAVLDNDVVFCAFPCKGYELSPELIARQK